MKKQYEIGDRCWIAIGAAGAEVITRLAEGFFLALILACLLLAGLPAP
jgi:hypothetical protein